MLAFYERQKGLEYLIEKEGLSTILSDFITEEDHWAYLDKFLNVDRNACISCKWVNLFCWRPVYFFLAKTFSPWLFNFFCGFLCLLFQFFPLSINKNDKAIILRKIVCDNPHLFYAFFRRGYMIYLTLFLSYGLGVEWCRFLIG